MTSVFHLHHQPGQPPQLPNAHALLAKAQHEFKHLAKLSPRIGAASMPIQEKQRP
jgi:hypothetical protein